MVRASGGRGKERSDKRLAGPWDVDVAPTSDQHLDGLAGLPAVQGVMSTNAQAERRRARMSSSVRTPSIQRSTVQPPGSAGTRFIRNSRGAIPQPGGRPPADRAASLLEHLRRDPSDPP